MATRIRKLDDLGQTKDGKRVKCYELSNTNGLKAKLINFGGALVSLHVPDRKGQLADIVCGFDDVKGYEDNPAYMGVLVGRFANRIGSGKFSLEGQDYILEVNNVPNHLHGGTSGGFSKVLWDSEIVDDHLEFTYVSKDGEAGYPGTLTTQVTYELTNDNELIICYSATTSHTTIINLTNHSYFNLAGHKSRDILDHLITVHADKFTPKTEANIPSGEIASVSGTALDLRTPTLLSERIHKVPLTFSDDKPGFDHNFCLENIGQKKLAAVVEHGTSGRMMECYTDQPAVQLYTANWVDGILGKQDVSYQQHCALCLETQHYPDSPNKPHFPSCSLRPEEAFQSTTSYKFYTK